MNNLNGTEWCNLTPNPFAHRHATPSGSLVSLQYTPVTCSYSTIDADGFMTKMRRTRKLWPSSFPSPNCGSASGSF